jgi:protein-S-isoprenylcysteine O-methyltransferase Ste14
MSTHNTKHRQRRRLAFQVLLLLAIFFAPRQFEGLPALPDFLAGVSAVAGVVIGAAGLALVGVSALHLGRNLTVFPRPKADGALTQTGVYGIVRHPMYGGVLLSALGWSLLRASLPGVILSLLLGLFFDRKARREEVWLVEKYPEYTEYRTRVRS